jgi:predicted  nucleic acid-binding Zn-ribbon protein
MDEPHSMKQILENIQGNITSLQGKMVNIENKLEHLDKGFQQVKMDIQKLSGQFSDFKGKFIEKNVRELVAKHWGEHIAEKEVVRSIYDITKLVLQMEGQPSNPFILFEKSQIVVKKLPLVFLQQNVGTLIEWDRIC